MSTSGLPVSESWPSAMQLQLPTGARYPERDPINAETYNNTVFSAYSLTPNHCFGSQTRRLAKSQAD